MKAVVVHAAGDLRVDEVPDPVCSPGDVLVGMEWGGVCGSDLSYVTTGISGTAALRHPLVLGHEVAGTIAEVGGVRPHEQGGFCGYRVVRPDQVRALPAGVSTRHAALAADSTRHSCKVMLRLS